MPHLVLSGCLDFDRVGRQLESRLERWRRAMLKTEGCWLKQGGDGLLVEGVVVELSRPLHPVAVISRRDSDTVIRLWSSAPVERTPAVQRWLALVASEIQRCGGGAVMTTNICDEYLAGLDLARD
jgi:hypothetical protein